MNLHEATSRIKDGVPYDVIVDRLLEAQNTDPQFWMWILETLSSHVRKGVSWLDALERTAKEWSTSKNPLSTADIVRFLVQMNILSMAKAGMTHTEILRVFSTMHGSEKEMDAYFAKEDEKKSDVSDQSTERIILPRGPTQEFKIKPRPKKKPSSRKKRPNDK